MKAAVLALVICDSCGYDSAGLTVVDRRVVIDCARCTAIIQCQEEEQEKYADDRCKVCGTTFVQCECGMHGEHDIYAPEDDNDYIDPFAE